MINVCDYILMILDKKKWSRNRLIEELNKIERKLGDRRTDSETVKEYLKGELPFRPKILAKWEIALDLREGTLMNMVSPPITKDGKEELRKTLEILRKVRM